ncbi:MAG: major facilitator transporter, partial [Conexibacter sp.]|nr:major facilitator transporter [Conexibacter sp.]
MIGRDAAARWAGGLPRTFWWLWLGVLVNRVGTVVQPFLALYLTTGRHLSVAGAGAVVAVTGAGSIAALKFNLDGATCSTATGATTV